VAGATIVLIVLLAVKALPASRVFAIWIVLLAAIALLVLVRIFRSGTEPEAPPRFELALGGGRTTVAARPPVFIAMERELELATSHAGQAHRRLLPLLRAAAAARLQAKHGIELEPGSAAARGLLGDEAWELLRPDRPAPLDPFGPGLPEETIVALIERVESL
jgi:hypothetical protein